MPKNITQYELLISCPGDVKEELQAIERCVTRFNDLYCKALSINILTRHWSKSSYSQSGDKPQNILNEQFVDDCDAAVAIFWTRFGTPTDQYGSGTEEEICKMLDSGKQVFMYFSDVPVSPSIMQSDQYKMVCDFKKKYKDEGLYSTYKSVGDFENLFFAHLSKHFLSIEKVAEIKNERVPILKIQSIDESCKLNDQLIVQTFSPCHKSIKDYVNDAEKKIQKINTVHLPKSNNNNDFRFLLGEKVELDKSKKEIIELFVKTRNIQLSEDFFEFGNLRYSITPQIMGGNSINGTSDEKSKYYLLSDTVDILLDCMHWSIIEKALSGLSCIKLLLTNTGTTYDEDVEISLNIPKEYYVELSDVFQFDNSAMGYLLNDCEISTLFGIKSTAEYSDYESSSKTHPPIIHSPNLPFINSEPDYNDDFFAEINDTFYYDVFEQENDKVIKIKFDYIKQHTSISFPSIIYVKDGLKSITYRISSKHNPESVEGIICTANE